MTADTSTRIATATAACGASWALLSGADSVCYAAGHIVPIETGASPFQGGPSLVLVTSDGTTARIVTNLEAPSPSTADITVAYDGFSLRAEPLAANYLRSLQTAIEQLALRGPVAVELHSLPAHVADLLRQRQLTLIDATAAFARARMVKTPRELDLLWQSAQIASLAQAAAKTSARPGITELELFGRIRSVAEAAAGERLPFAGDLVTGVDRTADAAGWPTGRIIQANDLVISDLAPRVGGYWADSCNTFAVGVATPPIRRMLRVMRDALDVAERTVQPGMPVSEVDALVRGVVRRGGYEYGHHTGHGIGTSVHEYPRIIPGESAALQVGMVILLEPGGYETGVGGVRLERMYEVVPTGLRPMTTFAF